MNILMLSGDDNILDKDSEVYRRVFLYAEKAGSIYVLVPTKKNTPAFFNRHLFVIPAHSRFRLFSFLYLLKKGGTLSRPDLITSQDPFIFGLAAYFLGIFFRAPVELQAHTDFSDYSFRAFSLSNRVRFFLAFLLSKTGCKWRVVSRRMKEFLKKNWRVSHVAHLPIFASFMDPDNASALPVKTEGFFVMAIISRLAKEKQIHLALRAIAPVIKAFPKTYVFIAGTGPEEKKLKAEVIRLGITKNIFFLGWLKNPFFLYLVSDLYILTSAYEGYGLTLAEAAFFKVPIISFDVGIAREVGARITNAKTLPGDLFDAREHSSFNPKPRWRPSYKNEDEYANNLVANWKEISS